MIIPIRCKSCGCPIAHLWETYKKKVEEGEERGKVMDELGIERYCCRAEFLGHAEMLPEISKFKKS